MGLEVGTYISDLVTTNPVGASDAKSQGDDHLRLIKSTIKNTFPNITGAMTLTHTQLNNAAQKNINNAFTEHQSINKAGGTILTLAGTGNNAIEIGRTDNVASTAHIDAHTGTTGANDYDSRIEFTGGTASPGNGTVNVRAAALQLNGVNVLTSTSPAFPSGTRMTFQQTSAPTGWTKELTHNNKAMRLVTGSVTTGGTVAFTTAFASKSVSGTIGNTTSTGTVQNHTLTTADIPAHTHGATGLTFSGNALAAHSHGPGNSGTSFVVTNNTGTTHGSTGTSIQLYRTNTTTAESAGTPSGTIGGSTASAGSGGAHNHGLVMDAHNHTFTGTAIDLAVQYVDFIIATKD